MTTTDAQTMFDAISSPVRREILWLTWADELSAGEIADHFALSAPTLSSHLGALREAGLVTKRVDGNFRRYRANHDALRALVPFLAANDERWRVADDVPERQLATAGPCQQAIVVAVDAPIPPTAAFEAFTDSERYSDWLGVPVRIRNGRFRTRLEWGTEVRGRYEVVHPPELLAMRWDFDDETVPLPGRGLVAYLRVTPRGRGSRVEVHQLAGDEVQAEFLATAWATVLGRFAAAHSNGVLEPVRRPSRPKHR